MKHHNNVIDVGDRKQLFIDQRFIEQSRGIQLRMNPPLKSDPILLSETEWEENRLVCYSTILDMGGEYYLYYNALPAGLKEIKRDSIAICLAVSTDGIEWKRRTVGLHEFRGSKENNIIMLGGHATPFIDPEESKGYRFKAISSGDAQNPPFSEEVCTWQSIDGIKWGRAAKDPVLPFACDTQNQCFYDARLKKYVFYLRSRHPLWNRSVSRGEVDDFYQSKWYHGPLPKKGRTEGMEILNFDYRYLSAQLPIVMHTDDADPPMTTLYTPGVHQYPEAEDVYLAFPSAYRFYNSGALPDESARHWGSRPPVFNSYGRDHRGTETVSRNDGPLSVQLAVSRDGIRWNRFRSEYIPPGLLGELDGGTTYITVGMIRKGNYIYQYYSGGPSTHGESELQETKKKGIIRRVIQRLDGFVSVDADNAGGELVTPPLIFRGGRLQLNIDCGALGEAWVEIQSPDGVPIKGYSLDECVSVDRNGVEQPVWWHKGPDASPLSGKPVCLKIKMRSAKLYAFQFVEELREG